MAASWCVKSPERSYWSWKNQLVPLSLSLHPSLFVSLVLPFPSHAFHSLSTSLHHCPPLQLTQPLQGAVAVDLGFHGGLVGRRQLGQVVEGMGEGRVAAVVPHAASNNAATADAARTFTATWKQGGTGGQLGGVVHTGSTLWGETERDGRRDRKRDKKKGGKDRWQIKQEKKREGDGKWKIKRWGREGKRKTNRENGWRNGKVSEQQGD